jgi:hypothetical protein
MAMGDYSQVYQEQEEEQGSGLHPQFICSQVREKRKLGHHAGGHD